MLWSTLAIHKNVLKGRGRYIQSNDPREILGFQKMIAFGNLCLACQVLPNCFTFVLGGEDFFCFLLFLKVTI